jgi:dTDP-4-dehydrorhamnose 3,5-epimerase
MKSTGSIIKVKEDSVLPDVLTITWKRFPDSRGWFAEIFRSSAFPSINFVQDNVSESKQWVFRGLHYQVTSPQGKLVTCLKGEILDFAIDIRFSSPTYKRISSWMLTSSNETQVYIPPGFAHGFLVISKIAIVHYKVTEFYNPELDRGINYLDPEIKICNAIPSHIQVPPPNFWNVSKKDSKLPFLKDIEERRDDIYV